MTDTALTLLLVQMMSIVGESARITSLEHKVENDHFRKPFIAYENLLTHMASSFDTTQELFTNILDVGTFMMKKFFEIFSLSRNKHVDLLCPHLPCYPGGGRQKAGPSTYLEKENNIKGNRK
ncbi:hypothetical protein BB8028_0003g10840 [Beauveria bassiana]|uniref:Uncharacterized protein n=1 Tax=Beauveria bassiana TaxID=176275 RepID=A0A2S7Y8M9_BEABA|nr:hypothetical protein BB8028_0003g10840 [Beauveria bassiana]